MVVGFSNAPAEAKELPGAQLSVYYKLSFAPLSGKNSKARAMGADLGSDTATVLMSGGIDSTACADFLTKRGNRVQGVLIDYGQAAAKLERRAAETLAERMQIPLTVYKLSGGVSFGAGELVGRNAFLIFAGLFLSGQKSGLLAIGVHAGTPYYDCSPAFMESMSRLVAEHTDGQTKLVAPFLNWNKAEIFQYFNSSNLAVEYTYSCEAGTDPPCGVCASCRDRRVLGC